MGNSRRTTVLGVVLVVLFLGLASATSINVTPASEEESSPQPVYSIVESIPVGLDLTTDYTTGDAWLNMINSATDSLDLALFYMSLTNSSMWPAADGGEVGLAVYNAIIAASQRGVRVRIVLSPPSPGMTDQDALQLNSTGVAQVRFVNWTSIFGAGGILHTKLLIADSKHYYLGSANADWTSLTQVKELGIYVRNSTDTGADIQKLFDQYWYISNLTGPVTNWPSEFDSPYNLTNPLSTSLNGSAVKLFFAYSPPGFEVPSRTADLAAIQAALASAQEYFCLEVMDYIPITEYMTNNIFWPDIDDAIRSAAFRGVQVQMLIAKWNNSNPVMFNYLNALASLPNVSVSIFEVPDMPGQSQQVPFTRVNHAKYFVTDQILYIGTSNWVGDYFLNTGGVSVTINDDMIRKDVLARFQRDWTSEYAHPVEITATLSNNPSSFTSLRRRV